MLLAAVAAMTACAGSVMLADSSDAGHEYRYVDWSFDSATGILTIAGSGDMPRWSTGATSWYRIRNSIETVETGEGVTSVGYTAFADYKSLTSIIIQESVTKIMGEAFRGAYEYIMVYNLSNLNLQSGKCGLSIHATVKTSLPSSEADAPDAGLLL